MQGVLVLNVSEKFVFVLSPLAVLMYVFPRYVPGMVE